MDVDVHSAFTLVNLFTAMTGGLVLAVLALVGELTEESMGASTVDLRPIQNLQTVVIGCGLSFGFLLLASVIRRLKHIRRAFSFFCLVPLLLLLSEIFITNPKATLSFYQLGSISALSIGALMITFFAEKEAENHEKVDSVSLVRL